MPLHSDPAVQRLVDESDIRALLFRYCRGIDRKQLELVRSCYHPDAVDNHGVFVGGVDDFLAYVDEGLEAYERTMHFLGNILVELDGDRARSEAYAIAFHRVPRRGSKPERDLVVGLRYVDDLERRAGEWRIAHRICAFDWTRLDPVPEGWTFPDDWTRGVRSTDDAVFAPWYETARSDQ